jgi:hypothetical protein
MDIGIIFPKSNTPACVISEEIASVSLTSKRRIDHRNCEVDSSSLSRAALKKQTQLMPDIYCKTKRKRNHDEVVQDLNSFGARQLSQFGCKKKREASEVQESEDQDVEMLDADALSVSLKKGIITFDKLGIDCSEKIFDCAGSTFSNVMQDCSSDSKLQVIDQIFSDLNADQTKLLVKAISAISRDKKDVHEQQQSLSFLISNLNKDALLFLLKESNYLDIPVLQKKCTDLLAQDASYSFKEIAELPYELAEPILMRRFDRVDRLLLKRGGSIAFQVLVSESMTMETLDELGNVYVVQDNGRVFLYDVENSIYKEIMIPCDYKDSIYFEVKIIGSMTDTLIVKLSNRILKYNFATDKYEELFLLRDREQFCSGMLFNQTETSFLVCTSADEIYVLDLQRNRYRQIVKMEDGESVISNVFNQIGDRAVVLTNRSLINYDIEKGARVIMSGIHMREAPRVVIFDSLKNHLFLHSNDQMDACNVQTGQCEQIFNVEPDQSIRYASYQASAKKLFIETDHSVYMYDEQVGVSIELFHKQRGEHINEKSATINKQGDRLLVQTNRRALLFDLSDASLIGSVNLNLMRSATCSLNSAGDKILIIKDNKLFLYTVARQELQRIFQIGRREMLDAGFNPKDDQVLIRTNSHVFIYDVDAVCSICLFEKEVDECLQDVQWNNNKNVVIVVTNKRVLIYDSFSRECKGVFLLGPEENICYVQLNELGNFVLIKTDKRLLNWTISDISLLQQLNAEQCDFIAKVSHAWQCNKPHLVKSDEVSMYHSLPDLFKQVHLFI